MRSVLFFFLFRAAPAVAKLGADIRATAAGLCHSHSNIGSDLHLQITPQFVARPGFLPTGRARDQTCILRDTSWALNPLSHNKNASVRYYSHFTDGKTEAPRFLLLPVATQLVKWSDHRACTLKSLD